MTNQTPTEKEPISQDLSNYVSVYNILMYARSFFVLFDSKIKPLEIFDPVTIFSRSKSLLYGFRYNDDFVASYKKVNQPDNSVFTEKDFKMAVAELVRIADRNEPTWREQRTFMRINRNLDIIDPSPYLFSCGNNLGEVFDNIKSFNECVTIESLKGTYIPLTKANEIFKYPYTTENQREYHYLRRDFKYKKMARSKEERDKAYNSLLEFKATHEQKYNKLKDENERLKKENDELKTSLKDNNNKKASSRSLGAITTESNYLKLTVYGLKLVLDDINNGKDFKRLFPRGVTNNAIATNIENCFHKKAKLEKAIKLNAPNKDTVTKQIKKGEGVYKSDYTSLDDYNAEQIIEGSVTACNS